MKTKKLVWASLWLSCAAVASEPVKVSSFGFDPEDSTRFLQAAFDSDAPVIRVDKMPSPWVTAPLKGFSNKRVIFDDGAEVVAKAGAFTSPSANLMHFINCSNVTLSGHATLRMRKADYLKAPYAKSEHRHALNFYGCRNISIEGLTIAESGGDGIYLGQGRGACRDIVLREVVCTGNYRQAVSVISVDGLLVERCTFKDTAGTPPAAGIDFEPNRKQQSICNVTLRDSVFENNAGCGIEFHLMHLDATSPRVSVQIENCRSIGNRAASFKLACNSGAPMGEVRGSVACRNCELDGSAGTPFVLMKKQSESIDLSFEGCRWREKGMAATRLLKDADWRRKVSSPVFIGGSTQILPVKTDLAAARIVDEKPGEMVLFQPVATRYSCNYTICADRARTVRLRLRTDRILGKFDRPSGDMTVSRIGGEVARFPMPGAEATEVSFDVPEAGFYSVKAGVGVGGMVELSGSDVPIALDAESKASLFKPVCRQYFEVQDADVPAAVRITGGGPSEKVAARIVSPSGKVFWETREGAGAMHRIMLPRGRETGLWEVSLGKATEGSFEDAAFSVVGIPNSRFPSREKRWTWMK